MTEYWNGIKISDIKDISGVGGSYRLIGNKEAREEFTVYMNDGKEKTLYYISNDSFGGKSPARIERRELKRILNERDNVPEIYYLYTKVYANINGQAIHVGYEVENNINEYENFSLNEIDELRKQFKIGDKGFRSLVYIQVFQIDNNKVKNPIDQKWIDQLISMGYDISKLEYTIK